MRLHRGAVAVFISAFAWLAACQDETEINPVPVPPPLPSPEEVMAGLPASCAFECDGCPEPEQPFDCPTMKPWAELSHADACLDWDETYPAPVQGRCTATEPTTEAVRPAGPFAGGVVLPDGRRISPAGREH